NELEWSPDMNANACIACFTIQGVRRPVASLISALLSSWLLLNPFGIVLAQGGPTPEAQGANKQEGQPDKQEPKVPGEKPQVKYNYLNVCDPSDAETKEISSALDRIPAKPAFSKEFEVTRGRTNID